MKAMCRPVVVVALPFAYQDGMDKYNGIMRYLREAGLEWELRIVRDALNAEKFRQCLLEPVAGVICGTANCLDDTDRDICLLEDCLHVCHQRGIPLVGLDWPLRAIRGRRPRRCSFLNIDDEVVGRAAGQALLKAGEYASYGFVGISPNCSWSRERGAFFARTVRGAGRCSVRIYRGSLFPEGNELVAWLKALSKPAAVFAANDFVADVVLKACGRHGLRVPEDMSVLGVDDDSVFCVHTRPTLSSVHPDFEEMGYRAAEELERIMSGNGNGKLMAVAGVPSVTLRMSTAPCSPAGMMVRRVEEIIGQRACQNIDSNDIAASLKISRRLLDLRYRQLTGMTVREAIVQMRIKRARHLLSYTGHSIGTISRMCGYKTESYLGKVFQKVVGMSMGDYREKNGHA